MSVLALDADGFDEAFLVRVELVVGEFFYVHGFAVKELLAVHELHVR